MEEKNIENVKGSFLFTKDLLHAIDALMLLAPFHLNVIDELHINENGHSRILCKLLQYRSKKGDYEILESFLLYIKQQIQRDEKKLSSLSKIREIKNPIITQEEERIDLWIREKNKYALIFENKVCGASDQEAQIHRYIKKTRKSGFKDEQIFVIYLPQTKDGEPSDQTWGDEKEKYLDRYFKIPFKENVLPWLEDQVLPNVRIKDDLLISAIKQYIDYLKGFFQIRNINNMTNGEQEILDRILEMKEKENRGKVEILDKKIQELKDTISHLEQYREDLNFEILQEEKEKWKEKITKDFPDFDYCDMGYGGVFLEMDGIRYRVYVNTDSRWYCQLEFDEIVPENERIIDNESIRKSGIRDILILPQNFQGDKVWRYLGYNEEVKSYECMKDVLKRVRDYCTRNK